MVQLRLMKMPLVLQVFDHKPKYWTNSYFDLIVTLDETSGDQKSYEDSSSLQHAYLRLISPQW